MDSRVSEQPTEYFGGLPDKRHKSGAFNRWQAAALGSLALTIVATVVGNGAEKRPLLLWAMVFAAVALPTLIMYLMHETDPIVRQSGALRPLLGIGQSAAAIGFVLFTASYSWLVAGILVVVGLWCLAWSLKRLPTVAAKRFSDGMWFPTPEFHRDKSDRLQWALVTTLRMLDVKDGTVTIDRALEPSDFDGVALAKVTFTDSDIEARFQEVFRRNLADAARVKMADD